MYIQMVEKLRQDLSIYDDTGVTFKNIYGERYLKMSIQEHQIQMNTIQQQILNANQKSVTEKNGGTIYFILGSNLHNMLGLLAKPIGIVYKVVSKNTQLTDTQNIWQLYKLRGIYDSTSDKDYLTKDLIAQYHIALGENYFDAGDTNNAKLEYKKASQIGKDIDAVQSAIASIFTKKGLIEEAFEGSKLAVERNQWDPDLHNNLATAYLGKGMLDEAIKEYKKALELNPKLSEVYNNLGITYLQKGDYENAKLSLSKACMLSPADAQVYNNLGMTYAKLNNLPLAVSAYKKALSIKPNYVDAHFNLGNIYLRSGENDLALQEYKYAISLAPTKAEIYNNTGVAYGNKKDFDNAIEFYKKAIDVNPKYAEAYNNLAGAYYNKGDFKKAKLFWENTLKLDSTHKAAKEYLIQLGNIRN